MKSRIRTRVMEAGGALAALGVFHVIAPPPAAAYIDPLSGSILFQVVAAGIVGALVGIRQLRDRIVGAIRNLGRSRQDQ